MLCIKGESEKRIILFMQSAGVAAEDQGEYSYFETLGEGETVDFVESLKEDLGERDQRISKYEEDAKRLNDKLRNLEVEATTSKRYVKEKDAELKKTNAKVTRQEKMITELKDSVSKLEIERNDLAKKVENYEKLL